jgi:DNA-binding transcriptional MocR family regulator
MRTPTDLANGEPHDAMLPTECISAASNEMFRNCPEAGNPLQSLPLQYGDFNASFRTSLAAFINRNYETGHKASINRLVATAGVSQGLDMCCSVFSRSGDIVLVEDPTYFLVFDIFRYASIGMQNSQQNSIMLPRACMLCTHVPAIMG